MDKSADNKYHVLAVDDNLIDRTLIERLLKTSSYHGNYISQDVDINLVITDYSMPGMTGHDLLKRIKESTSLKDIPVVIMSSENIPAIIDKCLKDGAEGFFLKPVQQSDVNKLRPHKARRTSAEQHTHT
ncbi:Signal transduction response regulator, receiver domain [Dillenia turbinata]|uniref:Signal transduction response regulator, receiver domain n=1 Tax=Dillenia turbinata TaxID=194707 RepID=A0AAN8VQ25_9MAGN